MKRVSTTTGKEDIPEDSDDAVTPLAVAEPQGEDSKVKLIISLLKKFMSVKDIANLRLSLPASLMAPIPNLEYWTAGDRADMLACVGDSEDAFERMLAVLRFTFTIQLKFIRGNVCKPYNSVLGEHFRCHWEVPPPKIDPATGEPIINGFLHQPYVDDPSISGYNTPGSMTPIPGSGSDTSSIKSLGSRSNFSRMGNGSSKTLAPLQEVEPVKVAFLCEQVSHHPPISSAYYYCPSKGIEAYGVDQISAKVSGMTVRIGPGSLNKGTFVKINREGPGKGEEYQITNPQANVNGLLKGTFYGTISDSIYITCRGGDSTERYRTIIEYKDESWISKPRFLLEGVIYKYKTSDASTGESFTRIKDVPPSQVVATFEGCWRSKINLKMKGEKESRVLIDLDILAIIPKIVRPLSSQDAFESRKLWDPVTEKMLAKSWGEATSAKQAIEQDQRDRATERKKTGEEHIPMYFEPDISDGRPKLTEAGRKALEAELAGHGY